MHGTSTMVLIIKIFWYFLCWAWNLVTSFSNEIYDRDRFTFFSYLIAFWIDFSLLSGYKQTFMQRFFFVMKPIIANIWHMKASVLLFYLHEASNCEVLPCAILRICCFHWIYLKLVKFTYYCLLDMMAYFMLCSGDYSLEKRMSKII